MKILLDRYPATVTPGSIAGVPVTVVTPRPGIRVKPYVLINIHGGAYEYDCCSLSESIPLASVMQAEVVAVLYRLAPEHPYPAGIDDVIAVYRELLKNHSPSEIAIYGTSSGAVMTGEVAMKRKTLGLPEPAALGIFSGFGDFSQIGDSQAFFTGAGLGRLAANLVPHQYARLVLERHQSVSPCDAAFRRQAGAHRLRSAQSCILGSSRVARVG
ncbi:MAG: alpha/beta hydrolase fold domain-containing protein [Gemmatimonadaceae bacterium]